MAVDLETYDAVEQSSQPPRFEQPEMSVWGIVKNVLTPVASLRLTVVLFAFSIFLILAGTFAQVDKDIWEVIGQYFRCWFAWISFPIFFPPSFVPEMPTDPSEVTAFGRFGISTMQGLKRLAENCVGMWFPGGKLIGLLLGLNLLSAHIIRFKAQAKGLRLLAGVGAIGIGCAITWFIIAAAGTSRTFQTEPWVPYSTLWIGFEGALGLLALASVYGIIKLTTDSSGHATYMSIEVGMLSVVPIGLITLLGWLIYQGDAGRPTDASLRILWQLTQGSFASAALLIGCWIVFGRRAGIVLLHSGIGLLMAYELEVAMTAVETQMHLLEGETTNFTGDIRTFEVAVIDKSKPGEETITAIPRSMIKSGGTIDLPDLPFKIGVQQYFKNSYLTAVPAKATNPATTGLGKTWFAHDKRPGSGTDMDSKIDMPSAYITLTDRASNQPIGTYLVGMELYMRNEIDGFTVDGKPFELSLRPKRFYKPFKFRLKDVRKEDYIGTTTPRHYASTVFIDDATRNVTQQEKTIWMNNPLRFAEETFYQSNYQRDELGERTTFSVVANTGWMMPYVACMLVTIGMLAHFLRLLINFLNRSNVTTTSAEAERLAEKLGIKINVDPGQGKPDPTLEPASRDWSAAIAAAVTITAAAYIFSTAMPPARKALTYDLYQFGQIPVVQDGRVKPLDSAAYSALLEISGRSYVNVGEGESKRKIPAIQWLLDVIAETPESLDYDVFRIENLEVHETIGVTKREGMRYSRKEIAKNEGRFREHVTEAREVARKDRNLLSVYQRKLLELDDKVSTFDHLRFAFGLHHRIGGSTTQEVVESFQKVKKFSAMLEQQGHPILAIGPVDEAQKWRTFSGAYLDNIQQRVVEKKDGNPGVTAWESILTSYSESKEPATKGSEDKPKKGPQDFNLAVESYLKQLKQSHPRDVNLTATGFEAYFNHFKPFTHANRLYVVAFVLGTLGWLGWTRTINRVSFAMLCLILALHTFALIGRIYISGRPPVTNLYSSAVFIGWGCVVLGLVLEWIFRLGIGNLIAAVAGYATLLIADGLALKGDTFTVLQAVLDTQFWLATHVTTITLGYATTYLAGLLGLVYVMRGVFTTSLTPAMAKDITRMMYGTLCFSIFFSFVGTVLGGLWADDSWGRFWGWDPKENGALIIVLWNALVLHARWGGMIKERGMAVLAIAGNIFVSWSWWGVNELGAGLHSYGFTEGTVIKLGLFVLSQLVFIGIGLIPKQYWVSFRPRPSGKELVAAKMA